MAKKPPMLSGKRHGLPRKWSTTTTLSRHARGYGWEWEKKRKRIMERDRYLCQPCLRASRAKVGNEVDHVKPKHLGGTDDDDNLETTCTGCHKVKTAKEARERRNESGS